RGWVETYSIEWQIRHWALAISAPGACLKVFTSGGSSMVSCPALPTDEITPAPAKSSELNSCNNFLTFIANSPVHLDQDFATSIRTVSTTFRLYPGVSQSGSLVCACLTRLVVLPFSS